MGNKKSSPALETDRYINESMLGVFVPDSVAIEWESISAPVIAEEESPGLMSSMMNSFGSERPERGL